LADGDVTRAWHFNPAGVLLFAVAATQLPYRAAQIWRLRRGSPEFRVRWLAQATFWLCLGALLGQWLWRTFLTQVAGPL
jgi:hypothetical protein